MNYSKSQEAAIRHGYGPMLVLAGPGSGKTAVITQRIVHLIRERGADASSILVITFTRAAANEMKQRFLGLARRSRTQVSFGTFHAVFFTVLRHAYGFEKGNIASEEQRCHLMREILSRCRLDCRDENELIVNLLGEVSLIKNGRIDPAHFYSSHCGEEIFRDIYAEYNRRMAQNRLIDFDDMQTYAYDLFAQRPDILSAWQKKYTWLLVDEFQDINRIQYDIVRMLAAPENNLFAVGDDDQAIYRFRGAKPEIMLGFTEDYPDAKRVLLGMNYRCAPKIVDAAGRLIAHNAHRFDKQLKASGEAGGEVTVSCFEDQRKENAYVIEQIQRAVRGGTPPGEIAVLCRTNTQPRLLLEQMLEQNVAFCTRDKIPNIYEHWIARDFFAYLRIAQGGRERADFLSVMNKPKRYISRDSLCEPEVAFDEWIRMYDEKPWVAERIEKLWADVKLLGRMNPYAAINYIRKGIGYDDYIADYAEYRSLNKDDLYEVADEILEGAKGYPTMETWLAHIREYGESLAQMKKKARFDRDSVVVSTLHSAKGLEYEQVFLLDVNEGIMPYRKAVLGADVEEERRLFYVGMTRAKRALFVCSVKKANGKELQISRFVAELQEAEISEKCRKRQSPHRGDCRPPKND